MRRVSIYLGASLGLFFLGCMQRVEEGQPSGTEHVGVLASSASNTPRSQARTSVELLEPGIRPRRALRYDFSAVKQQTVEMVAQMTVDVRFDAQKPAPIRTPPVRVEVDVIPQALSPTGGLRYDFKVTAVDVVEAPADDPHLVLSSQAELSISRGVSGWAEVSPRGFVRKADLRFPAGTEPGREELVDAACSRIYQLSAPLPEEPVGAGARWRVFNAAQHGPIRSTRVTTYTLKKLAADVVTLEIAVSYNALPPETTATALDGAGGRLSSIRSRGSGISWVNLRQLGSKTNVQVSTTWKFTSRVAGLEHTATMHIDEKLKFSPK